MLFLIKPIYLLSNLTIHSLFPETVFAVSLPQCDALVPRVLLRLFGGGLQEEGFLFPSMPVLTLLFISIQTIGFLFYSGLQSVIIIICFGVQNI